MRYKLPPGITAISVCGVEFQGDEKGEFWVEPTGRQDIHVALQSPHGGNLALAPEQGPSNVPSGADFEAAADSPLPDPSEPDAKAPNAAERARAERRELLNQLASYGVRPDGRGSAPYLRELLAQAQAAAEGARDQAA